MNNVVWFRNDLRVNDNYSLFQACKKSGKVIGVYFLDPRQFEMTRYGFKKTEKFRAKFLLETLRDLKNNLAKKNISLLIFHDLPESVFPKLVNDLQISTIFLQKEWTSEEEKIKSNVKNQISKVDFVETYDQFLFHPEDIPYAYFSEIPEVFTVFRKKCEATVKVRQTVSIEKQPDSNWIEPNSFNITLEDLGLESFEIHPNSAFPFRGGESSAMKRLENYFFETENLSSYKQTRNGLIGAEYSSKLSAWSANGSISARTIYWKILQYEQEICKNEDTYWLIFELIWRDYFKYISLKHGNKIFQLDGILGKKYDWKFHSKAFEQWKNGTTNEPFVNANMVELQQTGFMSNRGRQNVASYWAKEWEQDWQVAAAYFESMLIDYDVHSNYGNWMYNAGVGNDPRDRKFNIKRQAEMYDAKGEYQRLWLK
ncbi:MAG TPA: DASH family cryptochrome [Flavobacterium sp.]|jgi:deoxyribodipyrimidine photo-lyase|nr:DASH family cryptochrome [Flavobacterium sp.]HQX04753.1 DASH family cryptochrome [Flavobacterium sp.]HRZ32874.1 DASH family cryptochrome [Flavobacterium sp.]HRZ75436.1 DASH family cryptochrome [Flavobacterium sp.]